MTTSKTDAQKPQFNLSEFLKRKNIEISLNRYGIEALSAMALGLFASLLIGVVLINVGKIPHLEFLVDFGKSAQSMTGAAIGVAVAFGLKAPPLVLFAAVITGAVGYDAGIEVMSAGGKMQLLTGGPAGSFIATIFGVEFGKLVSKETKVDIIVTPLVTLLVGIAVGKFVGPYIGKFMQIIGLTINQATTLHPIPMGIVVAVIMGLALTAPISSAAIAVMLGLDGLAAGAATAGCSAQMIGFAVMSYKENKFGGLIAQGLGTSMLQVGNIIKNPLVLIPPTLAGAILGPIATTVGMSNIAIGAGMGTCGLVGQIGTLDAMGYSADVYIKIILIHFVGSAVLTLIASEYMRKKNWIKFNDLKLDL